MGVRQNMATMLNETQRQQVAAWLAEGAKLSDVQNRLAAEFGLHLTYMEVRLLVDDLKLMPKDPEPSQPARVPPATQNAAPDETVPADELTDELPGEAEQDVSEPPPAAGRVKVSLDQIARPGALVSGQVTFSDGQQAGWYLDQLGRLGVVPRQQGYKPSARDIQEFQLALQDELARQGF